MEEYDAESETDSYGRFKSQNSYLVKNNSENYPIVDSLVNGFSQVLIDFGLAIEQKKSELEISFDIDNPTAFLHKGFWRTSAGFFQDALKLNFSGLAKRSKVLLGLSKDPYLNFDAIFEDLDLLVIINKLDLSNVNFRFGPSRREACSNCRGKRPCLIYEVG